MCSDTKIWRLKKSIIKYNTWRTAGKATHFKTRGTLLLSWPTERSRWLQSAVLAPVTVRIRALPIWDSDITAIRPLKERGRERLTDKRLKVFSCQLRDCSLEMLQLVYQGDFLHNWPSAIYHVKGAGWSLCLLHLVASSHEKKLLQFWVSWAMF